MTKREQIMTEEKIGVSYPQYPESLEKGEKLLTDAIHQFHGSIVQARKGVKGLPENIAIKAAAGLGKTSQVISELCVGQVQYQKEVHIEYYVPTLIQATLPSPSLLQSLEYQAA